MKQASKVYAKSMIQNNGGEEKKDDNGTQNKDNVGKGGSRDEWKVQIRNIESSQVDQGDKDEQLRDTSLSQDFEANADQYEDVIVSNTTWKKINNIVMCAIIYPSIYFSIILSPVSVAFIWDNEILNSLLWIFEVIYVSYFISIHRYCQKRLVSRKSKILFAIYVMVIGASVFSLGNSNGENYLGFLRIIRFGHCMKHLNRFSKMFS